MTKPNIIEMTFIRSDNISNTKIITVPTIPQTVNYKYAPIFSEQSILGRLTPVYKYSGGSGASLSFSVELHEDPHVKAKNKTKTLSDLVEEIKSLSAPTIGVRGKTSNYPRIYFELGEIKAFVKVETNIEWNKPFRDGKYIMATVNFTLDVVEELTNVDKAVLVETISREVRGDVRYGEQGVAYTGEQLSYSTANQRGDLVGRYDVHLNNYIVNPIKLLNGNVTGTKTWDDTVQRLGNLFGVYANQMSAYGGDPKVSAYTKLSDQFIELSTFKLDLNSPEDSYQKLQKLVSSMIKNHDTFMNYYYENINKEMTRPEREQIKNSFVALLTTLETAAGGVMGYGATN